MTAEARCPDAAAPCALRPMSPMEFDAWQALAIPAYAADKVASGQWATDEALALSAQEHAELLPQGLQTPDHHLFTVVDREATPVGTLWFMVQTKAGARIAYVYDIEIAPTHQRQGHATGAFIALEDEVRRLGLSGIALHVFGHNHAARALYAKLGYEPTNISLFKPLPPLVSP
jgi:RimJ/RimL family protein N-acetyltransferase